MPHARALPAYEVVDYHELEPVECPCGLARRGFAGADDFPATIHVTQITQDARPHYHRKLTEVYYILECQADARMELNDDTIPLRPGMAVLIRPGTRHRAIGPLTALIVVSPKFDPRDEWFDEFAEPSMQKNACHAEENQ